MSPLGEWENQVIGRYVLEYGFVLLVPLVILVLTRRSLSEYGINFKNLGYHLKVVAVGIIPFFCVERNPFLFRLGSLEEYDPYIHPGVSFTSRCRVDVAELANQG